MFCSQVSKVSRELGRVQGQNDLTSVQRVATSAAQRPTKCPPRDCTALFQLRGQSRGSATLQSTQSLRGEDGLLYSASVTTSDRITHSVHFSPTTFRLSSSRRKLIQSQLVLFHSNTNLLRPDLTATLNGFGQRSVHRVL